MIYKIIKSLLMTIFIFLLIVLFFWATFNYPNLVIGGILLVIVVVLFIGTWVYIYDSLS